MMAELTPPEHEHSAAVEQAAQWLADQNPAPSPIVPTLRSRFDLSVVKACEAAALSNRYRISRRAFG